MRLILLLLSVCSACGQGFTFRDQCAFGVQATSLPPPDFRDGLIFELDAQTLSGSDGTVIQTWNDTSPNAYSFIANSGKGGYLTNSVALLGGKHGVTFLRSTPTAYFKTNFTTVTATNFTTFVVLVGFDGDNNLTEDVVHLWNVSSQTVPMYYNDGQNHIAYYDATATTFQEALGFVNINQSKGTLISYRCEATASGDIRTNGVLAHLASNLTYTKQAFNKATIGSYQDNSANAFNGIVALIRVYYLITPTNRQIVERRLGYVYGITVP